MAPWDRVTRHRALVALDLQVATLVVPVGWAVSVGSVQEDKQASAGRPPFPVFQPHPNLGEPAILQALLAGLAALVVAEVEVEAEAVEEAGAAVDGAGAAVLDGAGPDEAADSSLYLA
jgi:hypothetical protein